MLGSDMSRLSNLLLLSILPAAAWASTITVTDPIQRGREFRRLWQ